MGILDLLALLRNFGFCPGFEECPWDLNGNGVVDHSDLREKGGGKKYREVPICPRLYAILLETHDAAADGAMTVVGLSGNNMIRLAQEHAQAAGLTPWPKFYQAMRSSCENERKE
ncbi:MAG: hypothetical protein ACYS0G_12645 [Planctomycetota bacterium]